MDGACLRTCGHEKPRRNVGAKNLTLRDSPPPSGRDDARQALSELRRIVDAARHRIRRKLIRVRHKRRRHESHIRDPQRLRCERSDNLMANALAAIATARSLVLRNRLPMLCLGRFAVAAAVSKKIEAISRRHEQGDDDNE